MSEHTIAFVGGGHMASALVGGLLSSGVPAARVLVVEPLESQRQALAQRFGLQPLAAAGPALQAASVLVWAVKPQLFHEAAAPVAPHTAGALHLSVMAGIRCDTLQRATGAQRLARAMPNTPALIGQGMTGLYARPEVDAPQREHIQRLFQPTGRSVWVPQESDLDAVTALSGSGPAYGFYLLEAMMEAAQRMGLAPEAAREMAVQTVLGAAALAQQSPLSATELRAQVTSKGGTTHAALTHMEAAGVKAAIVDGILAAQHRARELGDTFSSPPPTP